MKNINDDIRVYVSIYDSKHSDLDRKIRNAVSIDNPNEVGERGIISRFWAQSQYIAIEWVKKCGNIPILWMDREEDFIIDRCREHFDDIAGHIKGASFNVQHIDRPLVSEKVLEKYLTLPDIIANHFIKGFNGDGAAFPTNFGPFDVENFVICIMHLTRVAGEDKWDIRTEQVYRMRKLDIKPPGASPRDITVQLEKYDGKYVLVESLKTI